ncbi:MAG: dihydropteroate synthase [Burkholderiales bacterium]
MPDSGAGELRAGRFTLSLSRPLVMGVVNITPDSFSDGGRFFDPARAVEQSRRLVAEGADLLDIGGESSRPGASAVALEEERRRVLPVLERVVELGVPVSVDTCKPELMREAVAAGAAMINDINGLRAPGALDAISAGDAAVCVMHMQGEPGTMQRAPSYRDVVAEVRDFLVGQAQALVERRVGRERIVLDPGFGFGKTAQHSLELLRRLRVLADCGFPVLAGLSRKSLLGRISGQPVDSRVFASVAAALLAAQRGACILRVHDVAATRDALLVQRAVEDDTYTLIEHD